MKEGNGPFASRPSMVGKWLMATTLGWAVSFVAVGSTAVHSWSEWQALVVSLFINGALVGTVVGLGQALVLGPRQVSLLKWTLVTLAAYAVGLPASVVLATGIALWTWPVGLPTLVGLPGVFITINMRHAALGGAVLGLGQWLVLRDRAVPATGHGALLWILGNVCGLGIGGVLATTLDDLTRLGYFPSPMGHIAARAIVGSVLGLTTGIVLVRLRSSMHAQPPTPR